MQTSNSYEPEEFIDDTRLLQAIRRLDRISGFLSPLCPEGDSRPRVFSRLRHIKRVAFVADRLASRWEIDREPVLRIVWLHDINRWAFAHNSEKGYYDQSKDIARFFEDIAPGAVAVQELQELMLFHKKDMAAMTAHGKCALLADMLTGVIEDPMMIVAGLNVNPEIFAELDMYANPSEPAELERLHDLARIFRSDNDPSEFERAFDPLFESLAESAVRDLTDGSNEEAYHRIYEMARSVKERVLRPVVFPINNESVSHSSWIKKNIVDHLIQEIGATATSRYLLQIDEYELLHDCVDGKHSFAIDIKKLYADLGYVAREEPAIAFISD